MILEFVFACIIIFACLAIYLDDAMYSLISLAITSILTATLYALNGALNAAIFHVTISVGTLVVLFSLSEELTESQKEKKLSKRSLLVLILSLLLPTILFLYPIENYAQILSCEVSFTQALWGLRGFDVILQGVVVLSVALGASIILYEERRKK